MESEQRTQAKDVNQFNSLNKLLIVVKNIKLNIKSYKSPTEVAP